MVVTGSLFSGMSTTVVMPPSTAAVVPVEIPGHTSDGDETNKELEVRQSSVRGQDQQDQMATTQNADPRKHWGNCIFYCMSTGLSANLSTVEYEAAGGAAIIKVNHFMRCSMMTEDVNKDHGPPSHSVRPGSLRCTCTSMTPGEMAASLKLSTCNL